MDPEGSVRASSCRDRGQIGSQQLPRSVRLPMRRTVYSLPRLRPPRFVPSFGVGVDGNSHRASLERAGAVAPMSPGVGLWLSFCESSLLCAPATVAEPSAAGSARQQGGRTARSHLLNRNHSWLHAQTTPTTYLEQLLRWLACAVALS